MLKPREQDFVSEARAAATKIAEGVATLEALQPEWQAMDYGTVMGTFEDTTHAHLNKAAIGAVVFATADALRGLLNTGHATNLYSIIE